MAETINNEIEPIEIAITNVNEDIDEYAGSNKHFIQETAIINVDYESNINISKDSTVGNNKQEESKYNKNNNHIAQKSTMDLDTDNRELLIRLSSLKISYNKPRYVYCSAELTLLCVNLQSQLFDAEIELKCYWQQPELARFLSKPANKDRVWTLFDDQRSIPIDIDDPFDGDLALEWIEKEFSFDFKTNTVCMLLHCKDQFAERMELERFPVDRQFLNILLMGRKNVIDEGNWIWITTAPKWVPHEYHDNKSQIQSRLGPSVSDYQMFAPWADFRIIQHGMDTQPPFKLRFRVQRYPGFYIGNIVVPLIFIIFCCFSSLVIPADDIADRLSVTITLMLATVAFRFVLTSLLPPVPYLTWMDYYITFSFLIVTLFIAENASAAFIPNNIFPSQITNYNIITQLFLANIDRIFGSIILLSLFIVNIFFIVAMCTNICRYSWKDMDKQDRESDDDDFISANPDNVAGETYYETNSVYIYTQPKKSSNVNNMESINTQNGFAYQDSTAL